MTHNPLLVQLPVLEVLEQAGLCYSIKNQNLEYILVSTFFFDFFEPQEDILTDFDIFIPEIAFELNHEDSLVYTSQQSAEQDRVLIAKNGKEIFASMSRSVVRSGDQYLLVTLYKDITQKSQEKQFDAFKQVFSESEVFEKILNRFSSIIFNSNDRKVIFEGVGSLIVDILQLEDVSIFLIDKKNQVLNQVLVIEKGEEIRYSESGDLYKSISITSGITGKAFRQKETILVDDVTLDLDYIADSIKAKSEIAVPIVYKNKVLGVLDSESTDYAYYTDRIKRILEGVASLLAIKINELDNYRVLQTRNLQLTSLIRSNPSAVAILNKEGNYLEISEKWQEQFVKGETDIIGLNHFELNPNLPLRWKKKISQALAGESQSINEESVRRKNGRIEFFSAKVNPWYKEKGELGGVIILAENVTDRKEKEVKLSQSVEELTEAKKIGKLFSWEADLNTGIFKIEAGYSDIPSFSSNTNYGLDTVFEHIDEDYHADFNLAIQNALNQNGSFSFIHPFTVDGIKYWLHNRGKVEAVGENIHRVVGTAQNITVQIDAEQAYKTQNIELKQINRELDQFVYKTAHDLRAPLTNLIGLIGLMRVEENKTVLNSYFDLQEKSIEKLDKFIKQITNYTKNARLEVQAIEISIKSLIDDILKEHHYVDNSDKITKIVQVEKGLIFYTDQERLRIVLNNIISNAIKFCDLEKEIPTIEIQVKALKNKVHISVRDNGVGISADQQLKVFDMFYRAHKRADGSGIGLYIVREALKKLNGQVVLNSEEGEYSQFDLFLPNLKPNFIK